MSSTDLHSDTQLRMAAVEHVRRIGTVGVLSSDDLLAGFIVNGTRIPLINPRRGIFKPAVMRHLLSIKTVYPVPGRRVWYDDQRQVHEQIERGEEVIEYAFMGNDPNAADNRWLREAFEARIPIIYFLGVAPGRYIANWPTYIVDWSAIQLKVRLAFNVPSAPAIAGFHDSLPAAPDRRYALQLVRKRLHQATFREAVLSAYGQRCAISGLPEPRLLDAAHIVGDRDEDFGQPVVSNGLPMTKFHHAAFDANLIGIDPDFRIHVSDELLSINDGPMLEHGIKAIAGKAIGLPQRAIDYPDKDRLAARFEMFRGRQ
jgi:putative restriction endonuclease